MNLSTISTPRPEKMFVRNFNKLKRCNFGKQHHENAAQPSLIQQMFT